jgi:SAM-dependent methyltransferase
MDSSSFSPTSLFDTDEDFDAALPLKIRKLSSRHWTPVIVAKRAAQFLAQNDESRILDIGSGVGKFCLTAATTSAGHFTGVEQRDALIRLSRKIAQKHHINNAYFLHANILTIDFRQFDAFYFFNSFEENRDPTDKIDDEVIYSPSRYAAYNLYLYEQFESLPIGTRIATYCSPTAIIPDQYVMVESEIKGKLKFWEKKY